MYLKQKYVKTEDNVIIVFSELLQHSEFKRFNPKSAGFISFGTDRETRNPSCTCYGESISLNLKSNEEDTGLADNQILGNGF